MKLESSLSSSKQLSCFAAAKNINHI